MFILNYGIIKIIFIDLYFSLNIEPINEDDREVTKSRFNEEQLNNWSSDSS